MRILIMTFLLLSLLISNAFAEQDCVGCESQLTGVAAASDITAVGEVPKVIFEVSPISEELLDGLCMYMVEGDFDNFMRLLKDNHMELVEIYNDVDCSKVEEYGPTILHTLVRTSARLLDMAKRLLRVIKSEKRRNADLDTASFFNKKIKYESGDETILDLIRNNKSFAKEAVVINNFNEIEKVIIELGAKSSKELNTSPQK